MQGFKATNILLRAGLPGGAAKSKPRATTDVMPMVPEILLRQSPAKPGN
jgi:hypothetical protein